MSERHGIERLRWLEGEHEFENGLRAQRLLVLGTSEANVEIAYALIEELHDALAVLSHPQMIVHGDPEFR